MELIFKKKVWVKNKHTKKIYKIDEAFAIISKHYKKQCELHPLVMKLFKKISGKNAIDFERIDRCLQSDSTRKVAPQHSEDLDTINLCLEYFLKFKILYLFSATPQATNPNRATILRDLLRFFSSYLILRENTRNEEFLAETIESLIDLPIDVITS